MTTAGDQAARDHAETRTLAPAPPTSEQLTTDVPPQIFATVHAVRPGGAPRGPRELADRYLVLGELGRGASATVYRAYDKSVGREVAVKVLHLRWSNAGDRLAEEARAMAKLADPNVVTVYDFVPMGGAGGGEVLLAMQYVEGQTLEQWLKAERAPDEVLNVFLQAGRGLWAAHRAGIVHRDFKPANVLVTRDDRALVTDFGIAGSWTDATTLGSAIGERETNTQGRIVGTPWYMAPEQHLGATSDPRVDQYAFCVALWEALARAPMFPGAMDTPTLIARKHEALPPWPHSRRVAPSIVAAIYRGLSLDADARFRTLAELLAALEPAPPRDRVLLATAAISTVAVAALAASRLANRQQQCTGAEEQLQGVWDDERRLQVRDALLATQVTYADTTVAHVVRDLDQFAAGWQQQHRDNCEATTVRGEQPASFMDLRMACLYASKLQLQAVTEILADADAGVVENAQALVRSLPDLARCADIEVLRMEVAPPAAQEREAVENVQAQLARSAAARAAGRFVDALERMRQVADQARQVTYRPIQTSVALERGLALVANGSHAEGEVAYKQALRAALSLRQWNHAVEAGRRLAELHVAFDRPGEGLAYAGSVRGLLRFAESGAEANLRTVIALLLCMREQCDEGEQEHRAALALAKTTGGDHHFEVAVKHAVLAEILLRQGRFVEAEQEQRAGLATVEDVLPPEHPMTAILRQALGRILYEQGRLAEAEAEQRASLDALLAALGPDHLHTAAGRENLASTLLEQGRDAEAEPYYRAALAVLHKFLGPRHANVVITQTSLGASLTRLGRHEEAEEHLRQALSVTHLLYGPAHPEIGTVRVHLAADLVRQGRYEEAETEARMAVVASECAERGQNLHRAYANLAAALDGQGRHGEATTELERALSGARASLGDEDPLIAQLLDDLGRNLHARGRYAEAVHAFREALLLHSRKLSPERPGRAAIRSHLATTLRVQGHHAEAEANCREGLDELNASRPTSPERAALEATLGSILIEDGRLREAVRLLEAAWVAWKDDERVLAEVRAQIAYGLARALYSAPDQRARAIVFARKARDLYEQTPPSLHRRERRDVNAWLRRHG